MENTDKNPATATSADQNDGKNPATSAVNDGNPVNTPTAKGADNPSQPYKVFSSEEEFNRHSAGILKSAKTKAENEILAALGLKPEERDKLAKIKEAYESTLTDAEKKAKELEGFKTEAATLKASLAEKDAIIAALSKSTGKKPEDVMKVVRMAKGLVDENTTMEQALETVLSMTSTANTEPQKTVPQGTPPAEPSSTAPEENPFKTGNLTEQGKVFKQDREKARILYKEATGKNAPW